MGPEIATVRQLISDGAALLAASGVGAARSEAMKLWAGVSGGGAGAGVLDAADPPGASLDLFHQAVRRRVRGEPLAHVIGRIGFRHLDLVTDRRALIPRPETEGLVDLVLAVVRTGRIADLGTGTGCLALSLATEGSFAEVVATDISPEALALARDNRDRLGAPVRFVRGDLLAPLRRGTFDALVANPPYLTADEYTALDASVRAWEPRQALDGGRDGLGHTTRILDEGRDVLRPGGWVALEIDCNRAAECAGRARALGWTDVAIHADLFGRERYLLAQRSDTP
jgi:release factor glutamine methyltransferase